MKVERKLAKNMAQRGMKLNTWGKAKGLSSRDLELLQQISRGLVKGKWGRSKELKEMLEKDGFQVAWKVKMSSNDDREVIINYDEVCMKCEHSGIIKETRELICDASIDYY